MTARRRSLRFAAGLALLASASCSIVTDFDGFTGGAVPPGLDDAGGDARDEAATDAADAGDGEAAPPRRYCETLSPAPTLCKDFDDGFLPILGFTSVRADPQVARVEIDTTRAASAPASVHVKLLDVPDAGGCNYADLVRDTTGAFSKVHIGFTLRNGDADGGSIGTDFQRLARFDPCGLTFMANAGQARLQTNSSGDFGLGAVIPAGVFTRVEIDVEADGMQAKLSVTVGGSPVLAGRVLPTCNISTATGTRFSAGFFCTVGPREANLDDIVYDVR